jgi:hypothetical protein
MRWPKRWRPRRNGLSRKLSDAAWNRWFFATRDELPFQRAAGDCRTPWTSDSMPIRLLIPIGGRKSTSDRAPPVWLRSNRQRRIKSIFPNARSKEIAKLIGCQPGIGCDGRHLESVDHRVAGTSPFDIIVCFPSRTMHYRNTRESPEDRKHCVPSEEWREGSRKEKPSNRSLSRRFLPSAAKKMPPNSLFLSVASPHRMASV